MGKTYKDSHFPGSKLSKESDRHKGYKRPKHSKMISIKKGK